MFSGDTEHDWDSSTDVWEGLYNVIYTDKLEGVFDFGKREDSETGKNCKRWYIKIDGQRKKELREKYPRFKMAGDCDFNFNDKKVELYKNILGESDEGLSLLRKCHENYHKEPWDSREYIDRDNKSISIKGKINYIRFRL